MIIIVFPADAQIIVGAVAAAVFKVAGDIEVIIDIRLV